jgi:hypothetical protein
MKITGMELYHMIKPASRNPACRSDLSSAKVTSARPVWFLLLGLALFSCASRHHAPHEEAPPEQRNLSAFEIRLQNAVAASSMRPCGACGTCA